MIKNIKRYAAKKLRWIRLGYEDSKQEMLIKAFNAIKSWRVDGDYYEFGVYRGRAFIHAYNQAKRMGRNEMRFYAFDSFEGLPSPSTEEGAKRFYKGQYACGLDEFKDIISRAGVDTAKVDYIKGFYSESLTEKLQKQYASKKAAIVWIDCDLFSSTRDVLNFITPMLQTGAVLCFDDWYCYGTDPKKGELYATTNWLKQNPHIKLVDYCNFGVSGKCYVVQIWDK